MNKEIEFRIKKFTEECDKLVFSIKDVDYNHGGIDVQHYFPFGWHSVMHDITKKYNRLMALLSSGKPPANESIDDNFKDLCNYVRIGYAVLKSQEAFDEVKKTLPKKKSMKRRKRTGY